MKQKNFLNFAFPDNQSQVTDQQNQQKASKNQIPNKKINQIPLKSQEKLPSKSQSQNTQRQQVKISLNQQIDQKSLTNSQLQQQLNAQKIAQIYPYAKKQSINNIKLQNVAKQLPIRSIPTSANNSDQMIQISQEMKKEDKINVMVKQKEQKKQSYDLQKGLSLEVKTLQKHFQFNQFQDQVIPIMVSVKTLDQTSGMKTESNLLEDRPNIDLVCVIDVSGSMKGSKIENVRKTIISLINLLNENDRLALVTFNNNGSQLCNLKKVNKQNKENIQNILLTLNPNGGTSITLGLYEAFSILQNRKQKNSVSSIFLLSDGQDDGSDSRTRQLLKTRFQQLERECFTIHSFGFGNDHDGQLMQKIAQIKDGSFYYVERSDQVDEFFIDALGGLFSVVAQDINIKIQINRQNDLFNKFFKNLYVSKTYGAMWNVVKKNEQFHIKINQIFSGVSKDFIFEITIPKSYINQLQDFERNSELVSAQLTATPIDSEYITQIIKESNLVLTLFTQNEKIAQDSEINDNVEFNYIRVKAAEAIEEAIKYADKNQYQEGQAVLQDMLKKIEKSHPKNKEKLQILKEDIVQCQQNVQPQIYQGKGKHEMQQQSNNHSNQQSYAIKGNDLYQNCQQRQMVQIQQIFKQTNKKQ